MKFDYEKSKQLTTETINPFFLQYHCKRLNSILLEYAQDNSDEFPDELEVETAIPNNAIFFTYSYLGAVPFKTLKSSTADKKRIILMNDDSYF